MGVNTHGLTVTEAAYAAIDAIRKLSSSIGIPSGLTELGVKTEDLAVMAENAQKMHVCSPTLVKQTMHKLWRFSKQHFNTDVTLCSCSKSNPSDR